MNTKDILLYEAGAGGDFAIINEDLAMGEYLYQQIYLALFGGNIEASTKSNYLPTEERIDYWGNSLIWKEEETLQFNSETERAIQNNALNSSGRLKILQAVETDLEYLQQMLEMDIELQIMNKESLKIIISFTERENQQNRMLQLVYSNAKNEVIIEKIL